MERITINKLNEKLNSDNKVLLVAVADWCGHSRMLKQIIEKHKLNYPEIVIFEIDVEDNKLWDHQVYEVKKVPSMFFFKEENMIKKIEDYQYENDLLKLLDQFKSI